MTAGSADAETAAGRLSAYLSTHYRYTLALKRQTDHPGPARGVPLRAPLRQLRVLRGRDGGDVAELGVPARVVAGFQQGEWNPYGRYFMVRLSDAHAWVEVYLDGRGWVAFDPSPRAEAMADEVPGRVSLYFDAARMRWYRYVVNWSLRDQVQLAASVHRQAADGAGARRPRDWREPRAG